MNKNKHMPQTHTKALLHSHENTHWSLSYWIIWCKANIFNVYGQSIFYWQSHSQHCDEDDKRSDYTASATDKIVQLHNRLHSENVTIAFFFRKRNSPLRLCSDFLLKDILYKSRNFYLPSYKINKCNTFARIWSSLHEPFSDSW